MARTKHTFDTTELPKVWLAQEQDEGRRADRRFYFTGDTIYSYGSHFPIAKILKAPNGQEIILFTTRTYSNTTSKPRTYSNTTSKHVSATASACRSDHRRIVYCHRPDMCLLPSDHESNLKIYKYEMDESIAKHKRARKPELYCKDILYQATLAREYCEVMCLPVPIWAQMPELGGGFVETDKLFRGQPMRALLKVLAEERVIK